ncbi:MAG: uroporphyrinogen decarboxylase family protein [Myxococcota bacterium]|nr:uroporphyrinogen decarboxylase family protein [Myxococcota bacterium]
MSTVMYDSNRIPVASLAAGCCAAGRGLPVSVMHEDPPRSFELQDEIRKNLGFDSHPFYPFATYGTWEHAAKPGLASSELRAEPTYPHYPVQSEGDLDALQRPDVARAGMLPAAMRFSELQQERGAPVSVVLGGVFTVAANICGLERLFQWLIAEPELTHRLLSASREHLLDVVKRWMSRFGADRVTPIVWEGMANESLLSPRHFEEFVIPHQATLHQQILELGATGLCIHLCGEQSRLLPMWAEVPMGSKGVVSLGAEVDLRVAREALGPVALMGNVDPESLRTANPDHVRTLALDCIERGRGHAAGFILAPGCDLQHEIPEANLRAMISATRR